MVAAHRSDTCMELRHHLRRADNPISLRLLLGLGADPLRGDSLGGSTALHWAVLGERVSMVSYLLVKVGWWGSWGKGGKLTRVF